jgi:hypothetical protein
VTVTQPSSFGQDACGRLYVASLGGQVSRIVGSSASVCPPPTDGDPPPDGDPPAEDPVAIEVKLRVADRSVHDGARARLIASARPCAAVIGEFVRLRESGDPVGKRKLDRDCRVSFRPRINSASRFRARVGQTDTHLGDLSRIVRVSVAR